MNKGIFTREGDRLSICFGVWSAAHGSTRPLDFTAKAGSNRVRLVLRRDN